MSLTPKKRRFVDAIRAGATNKDAAIAAGCSAKSASAAGSRLAKDPDVVQELHKLNALPLDGGGVKAGVKGSVKAEGSKRQAKTEPPPPDTAASALDDLELEGVDPTLMQQHDDPLDFLRAVMNSQLTDPKLRVDAAKALMPFIHQRRGEGGKKEEAKKKATAAAGKFSPSPPPLRVVGNNS